MKVKWGNLEYWHSVSLVDFLASKSVSLPFEHGQKVKAMKTWWLRITIPSFSLFLLERWLYRMQFSVPFVFGYMNAWWSISDVRYDLRDNVMMMTTMEMKKKDEMKCQMNDVLSSQIDVKACLCVYACPSVCVCVCVDGFLLFFYESGTPIIGHTNS